MTIFTIGFKGRTAEDFFEALAVQLDRGPKDAFVLGECGHAPLASPCPNGRGRGA